MIDHDDRRVPQTLSPGRIRSSRINVNLCLLARKVPPLVPLEEAPTSNLGYLLLFMGFDL